MGFLVIALPGASKVDGLREPWLIVVDVANSDPDHGVGVEFVLTGGLADNGQPVL